VAESKSDDLDVSASGEDTEAAVGRVQLYAASRPFADSCRRPKAAFQEGLWCRIKAPRNRN